MFKSTDGPFNVKEPLTVVVPSIVVVPTKFCVDQDIIYEPLNCVESCLPLSIAICTLVF